MKEYKLSLDIENLYGTEETRIAASETPLFEVKDVGTEETITTGDTAPTQEQTEETSKKTRSTKHVVHTFKVENGHPVAPLGRYLTGLAKDIFKKEGWSKKGMTWFGMKEALNCGAVAFVPTNVVLQVPAKSIIQTEHPIPGSFRSGIVYHDKVDKVHVDMTLRMTDEWVKKGAVEKLRNELPNSVSGLQFGPTRRAIIERATITPL
jgi:hypothetical protein